MSDVVLINETVNPPGTQFTQLHILAPSSAQVRTSLLWRTDSLMNGHDRVRQ